MGRFHHPVRVVRPAHSRETCRAGAYGAHAPLDHVEDDKRGRYAREQHPLPDEEGRTVDPRHRGAGARAQEVAVRAGPDRLRRRCHHRHRHLRPHRQGRQEQRRPRRRPGLRRGRASSARSPRSATPSSPPPSRWPAPRTPSRTPRSANCPPGSSAGTWCWSSRSARRWWPSAGPGYVALAAGQRGLAPAGVAQRAGRGRRLRLRHPRRRPRPGADRHPRRSG